MIFPESAPVNPGHVTAPVVNAYNSRGGPTRGGPVLHASPYPPDPYSPSGSSYRALCGAQVKNVTRVAWSTAGLAWTTAGPCRRCPACIAVEKPLKSPTPSADS